MSSPLEVFMSIRFSFDLGTNSIGWAVLEVQEGSPVALKGTGVRIFSNSRADKTYAPLNQERQTARSARRRRDRYLQRREHILSQLTHFGFFPADKEERLALQQKNPYELRAKALDEAISAHEFGRAIFHINQRRGFKSNRLSDGDDETGKIKPVIKELEKELHKNNMRTLGEYLYSRFKQKKAVRAKSLTPGKTDYELYFSREMYEKEFDTIWKQQKELSHTHQLFSNEAYEKIKEVIFYQRKLKPQTPGLCIFEDEHRCAWAMPIAQEFRILQDIHNIRIFHNREEFPVDILLRDKLKNYLENKSSSAKPKDVSTYIKKEYHLEGTVSINFERVDTKNFKHNGTTAVVSKIIGKKIWQDWDMERKNNFIALLLDTENSDEKLREVLCVSEWNLDKETADECISKIVKLPKGYCNLSKTALTKIVACLQKDIITYDEAVKQAGYGDHRGTRAKGYSVLPYYGEILSRYCIGKKEAKDIDEKIKGRKRQEAQYGKITNPTVHVGLNQLQKVVNELIRRYDKPQQIVLELLRDFSMGKQTKSDYDKKLRDNQAKNEKINKELEDDYGIVSPSRSDREKYRLWKELSDNPNDRRCPYSNEKITKDDVFSHATHIDHILPFSRTLDNSFANKVLCKSGANKEKMNKTPHEAWGTTNKWKSIDNNANLLPSNKSWRFKSDAMKRFEQEEGFLAHQLHSSQYFAKVAQYYLESLKEKSHPVDIWVSPGKLSAWLRHMWGLNKVLGDDGKKNRDDHRHHAVDAVVVGCIERGILNKVSQWASAAEYADIHLFSQKHREAIPAPWEGFREDVERSMQKIIVSHKSDRGKTGQLLEEQAYSFRVPGSDTSTQDTKKARYVGIHKNILDLTVPMIKKIASPKTRKLLQDYCNRHNGNIKEALEQCFQETGIRKVKIITKETVIGIQKDKQGKAYKGYISAGNWAYEIYEDEEGKWQGEMITRYHANKKNYVPQWKKKYPTQKMLMRLHNNDTVMLYPPHAPEGKLYRVCKMSGSIDLDLAELHEANDAARAKEIKEEKKDDQKVRVRERYTSLAKLQGYKLQKVHMSPTGIISFAKK